MYKRPAYDIKTSGIYLFKTKDKEYIIKSYLFERDNDTEDGLEIQDELRDELGSIVFRNSAWNRLSKGNTIIAKSNKGKISGTLKRIDDINNSEKYKGGGNIGNSNKIKLSTINKIKKLSDRIIEIGNLNLGDEDNIYSYSGNLSFKERRKLFEELKKLESELTNITDGLSKTQCQSIDSKSFQGLNTGDDYGYEDEYEGGGMIDLFEDYDNIPDKVNNILEKYDMEDQDYESLEAIKKRVEKVGYTFDFGLDAVPYGLRPINVKINEVEGYEDEYAKGGALLKGKGSRAKNAYNKEVDAYKWFVVDLEKKKALAGNEYKEDAIDALEDYEGDKNFKVVSKASLKKLGIEDPTSEWKYAEGGWLKDHKYVNKIEGYEMRYSKDKNHRKGYRNKKYAGGGEIESKIEDLQSVIDGDFPQFAKDKAKEEIEKLKKELHESKESKSEEKSEHKEGGSEDKKPEVKYKKGTNLYLKERSLGHEKGTELEVKYDFIPEYDNDISVRTTEGVIKETFKIAPEKVTTELPSERKEHKFKVGDLVVFTEGKEDEFYIVDRLLPFSKRFISYEVVIKKPDNKKEYIESEKNLKLHFKQPRAEKPTERILGIEYTVGTKAHAKAVADKKHLDDLNKSESSKEPAKKVSHKEVLAKVKAKKSKATPSNAPSKGHKRNEASDRKRTALPLGKRISESGNVYYENRLNRADKSKRTKFEEGGEVESNPFKTKRGCW
jgi:hypothetical protein